MEDDVRQSSADRYAVSQAYRWKAERDNAMQELRQLKDRSRDTTTSAYDLMPEEDREALAWVREQGGLRPVQNEVQNYATLCRSIQDADSRRIEMCSILGIDVDTGWSDACEELRNRLMPEGMEWPSFYDGEPVQFLDDFERYGNESCVSVVTMYQDGSFALNYRAYSNGERVNRPAPKVLDADGVEIHVGDTVYHVKDGSEMTVYGIEGEWLVVSVGSRARHDTVTHRAPVLAADGEPLEVGQTVWSVITGEELEVVGFDGDYVKCRYDGAALYIPVHGSWHPRELTHQRPVLDADGMPIKVGDMVWYRTGAARGVVESIDAGSLMHTVRYRSDDGEEYRDAAKDLTHERPDSWERIEADARMDAKGYCESRGISPEYPKHNGKAKFEDIVRRCRALAERERGE